MLYFLKGVREIATAASKTKGANGNCRKEIGFAVISNHPISQPLIDSAYKEWYEFFKSPEKNEYAFDSKTHQPLPGISLKATSKPQAVSIKTGP